MTENGPVRGIWWPGPKEILSYLDIPYGKFNTTFEAPSDPEPWIEILEVQGHNRRCPQLDGDNYVGDTDCLTLSVFIPPNAINASVLFYIHESGFTSGSGDPAIYGPEYLVPNNVILVLPNYRLGPLGFLCLRNSTAPGNAGLKDLALALEWTKNNIDAFGGDSDNIAVSGDGTSAALAGYLALSRRTRSLIKQVITDSGSVLSHWAIDRNPLSTAVKLANSIRDNISEAELGETVFDGIDIETLLLSAKDIQIRPCIETEGFLTATPWNILQNEVSNITFIIGSANHAGLVEALQHDDESLTQMSTHFATVLPNDLAFANDNERNNVGELIKRHYFGDGNITVGDIEELSLFYTDASYLAPSVRLARALVSAGATVFLYEFSFVGRLNKELVTIPDAPTFGAVRGDIVGYLFTQDGRLPVESTEKRIVNLMVELWANFLQTSEPTSSNFVWQPIRATNATQAWLAIGAEPRPAIDLHVERLRLWSEIYRHHFIERNMALGLELSNATLVIPLLYFLNSFLLQSK